jgi:uncharacterized damage-inducible protein DinB
VARSPHPISMSLSLSPPATPTPVLALAQLLEELASLVGGLPGDVYRARLAAPHSGSIGEHVRHCLDHVSILLRADEFWTLSYDHRQRGTAVETDPRNAVACIRLLQDAIETWAMRSLDEPIRVACMLSTEGDAVIGWSTLARELAFVVSHTIHHQAMIGVLLATRGYTVPNRFGQAPSTPSRQ